MLTVKPSLRKTEPPASTRVPRAAGVTRAPKSKEKNGAVKDGRHLRSERTRASIVSALLSLADQGELAPTAQQVADTAGVALRSIRQHFATREELFVAAAKEHARRGVGGSRGNRARRRSAGADCGLREGARKGARGDRSVATCRGARGRFVTDHRASVMATTRAHRRKEIARVFSGRNRSGARRRGAPRSSRSARIGPLVRHATARSVALGDGGAWTDRTILEPRARRLEALERARFEHASLSERLHQGAPSLSGATTSWPRGSRLLTIRLS